MEITEEQRIKIKLNLIIKLGEDTGHLAKETNIKSREILQSELDELVGLINILG